MSLSHRAKEVRRTLGVFDKHDWTTKTVADVMRVDGSGLATLMEIRFFLANRGIWLLDDRTAAYWTGLKKQGLENTFNFCPFTILVDSNETLPYEFEEIKSDGKVWSIKKTRVPLWTMNEKEITTKAGTFKCGLADYTIKGMEEQIQIERKTKSDLFLSLGANRDRMEARIARLNQCEIAFFLIEAEWSEILTQPPERSELSPKVISRTHNSWSIRYPRVHWVLCNGRRHAELKCFHLLERFWRWKMLDQPA